MSQLPPWMGSVDDVKAIEIRNFHVTVWIQTQKPRVVPVFQISQCAFVMRRERWKEAEEEVKEERIGKSRG